MSISDPLRTIPSNEEQQQQQQAMGLARSKAARPSNDAAKEFFQEEAFQDWTTLPARLERLSQRLEAWVRKRILL